MRNTFLPTVRVLFTLLFIFIIACSYAQTKKILLVYAEDPSYAVDVKNKLLATNKFSVVHEFQTRSDGSTPTITQLQQYDAVLVWSDYQFKDANAIGDVLTSYMDAGGSVVTAVFTNATNYTIGGSFVGSDYQLIIPAPQTQFTRYILGTIYKPTHPLMSGIVNFDGGVSSFMSSSSTLSSGSYRVADWSNGTPLIVAKDNVGPKSVRRVDLNFWPPSSDVRNDLWVSSTDGIKIIANALLYVANGSSCPQNISVPVDAGKCGAVVTYSAPSPSSSGQVLAGNQTFSYTGSAQTFTVPQGVTSLKIKAWGAQGGNSLGCDQIFYEDGGRGGYVEGSLSVSPGQLINLYVGGKPTNYNVNAYDLTMQGGYNGGGTGGYYGAGGGGASDVRVNGISLSDRIVVAGGGGGGNTGCPNHGTGGSGGGLTGQDGQAHTGFLPVAGGGTQSAGGTAGHAGFAGTLGQGGNAGTNYDNAYHYAGGGGGYYGGGSAFAAGGGGGSSFIGGVTNGSTTSDINTGNGKIEISWEASVAPTVTQTAGLPSGSEFPLGATTNTFEINDGGNISTCSFTVTVKDEEKPSVHTQNITVQLDANGAASITPVQINNNSTDNCTAQASLQLALDKSTFNCTNIGTPVTVTLTVTDGNGNSDSKTAMVTVEDKIKPVPLLANLPDVSGECTATVTTTPTATDNCGGTINGTTSDPLTYSVQGTYSITWTYDDGHGNTTTQTQKVIVDDVTDPVPAIANLPDVTAECSATITTVPTANDACKGVINGATSDALSYSTQGIHYITWTFNDGNGNIKTQQQKVIIDDVTDPYFDAIADKIIIINPATCKGKVPNLKFGLTGTDNCGGTVTFTQDIPEGDEYNTTHGATKTVVITADDGHGNTFQRTVKLISKDDAAPTFTCPPAQNVSLGANCSIVVPNLILGLTGDPQCGIISFSQSPIAGTVLSSGHNSTHTVIVTANDGNGNSTSCNVILTAKDVTKPSISCPAPITISCEASILPANTGSATAMDNCDANPEITYSDVSTKGSDPTQSNFYNYTITRTWKAQDAALNWNTCEQLITVQDRTKPMALCKPYEVYLGLDGTATITAADVNNGSNDNCGPVVLSIDKSSFNTTNVGNNTVILTVTDASGNSSTCQATVTVKKRPTILVYTGDASEQYSDQQVLTALLKDQLSNTVLSSKLISFTLGSQGASATTNASGIASANLILTQDPAPTTYTVKSVFAGDATFATSDDEDAFDILQEDARAYYTGALFASTGTGSSTTLTLSATIRDITAETGDAAYDNFEGDITKALVSFINRTNNTVIATVPVGLVTSGDSKTGTATYNWDVNIGTANSVDYTIGIVVSNYYTRNVSAENTIVTVSKSLDDFITGGGYLKLTSPAGQKAADAGTNNNFGFNVKFNKSKTNLQGNINTIIRRTEPDGLHVYQVKGNRMTSLSATTGTATSPGKATFNGQASIQDITNPLLPPVSVDGNATLQVTMTDAGEPGTFDAIAITVWNKQGGVWFASNWDGIKTQEQLLAGGNLRVNTGVPNRGTIANSITLTSSANPSVSGQQVTFRATVVETNAATPTGYIMFMDGTTVLGTVAVTTVSNVTSASISTSALTVGSHQIKAYYSGDAKFAGNTGTLTQTINSNSALAATRQKTNDKTLDVSVHTLEVNAAPNPSSYHFTITIKSNGNEKMSLRVVDVLGRTIERKEGIANGTLQIGNKYRPGTYIVEVMQGNQRRYLKLIKGSE